MSSRLRIIHGWPTVWMPKPKITGPTAWPLKKQKECIEKAEALGLAKPGEVKELLKKAKELQDSNPGIELDL